MPPIIIYVCIISYLLHWKPLDFRYLSVSLRVKGIRYRRLAALLKRPPTSSRRFFAIQVVAEPQTISMRLSCWAPQPFQKDSKAARKSLFGVSNHGNSSMNTTFFRFPALMLVKSCFSAEKASNQSFGVFLNDNPYSFKAREKFFNCTFFCCLYNPVTLKSYLSSKNSFTRNVFPTRRRP